MLSGKYNQKKQGRKRTPAKIVPLHLRQDSGAFNPVRQSNFVRWIFAAISFSILMAGIYFDEPGVLNPGVFPAMPRFLWLLGVYLPLAITIVLSIVQVARKGIMEGSLLITFAVLTPLLMGNCPVAVAITTFYYSGKILLSTWQKYFTFKMHLLLKKRKREARILLLIRDTGEKNRRQPGPGAGHRKLYMVGQTGPSTNKFIVRDKSVFISGDITAADSALLTPGYKQQPTYKMTAMQPLQYFLSIINAYLTIPAAAGSVIITCLTSNVSPLKTLLFPGFIILLAGAMLEVLIPFVFACYNYLLVRYFSTGNSPAGRAKGNYLPE
ncbi:MAG: hypothetical protein J0I41_19730 [Filimonas sp.]|nr:hypothetical protein [Filimonas sp.]